MSVPVESRRIVVDVSDLVAWHGNLSGIQRVVAELAYRYEAIGATFCYYLEQEQQFYAMESFGTFMQHRAKPTDTAPPSDPVSAVLKRRAKKVAHLVTPPAAWALKHRLTTSSAPSAIRHDGQSFEFKEGDIFLVFGAHWDKPHYTGLLSNKKSEFGLFIGHLINDLIPVFDSAHVAEVEHTRFPKYMREITLLSDLIFLESESTARDFNAFVEQQGIADRKPDTQLVILGENIKNTEAVMLKGFKQKDFVLSVGTIEVRKNHTLLYMAYKRAKELGIKLPHLVIVGRKGWLADDIYYQLTHDADIKDDITIIHDADDKNLAWFYKNCQFVVFPSFYEGWGLPVAEAAHYGKVTAASNASSIPEVVGDAATYFSPFSADECLRAIQLLADPKQRAVYERKIESRNPNTWDATFDQTFDKLQQLIGR